jgi:hypothetical protein
MGSPSVRSPHTPLLTGALLLALVSHGCRDTTAPEAVTIARIELHVPRDTITAGDTVRLHAAAYTAGGTPVLAASFLWVSRDTSIAVVDTAGLVRGIAAGSAEIVASVGVHQAAVQVMVRSGSSTRCSARGGTVHTALGEEAVWRSAGNPHRVLGDLNGGTLHLEPGVVVCSHGGVLNVAMLTALGTGDAPVYFSAADSGSWWGGLVVRGDAVLRHTVVENASAGIRVNTAQFDSVVVRRARQEGVAVARGVLRFLHIEEACLNTPQQKDSSCSALAIWGPDNSPVTVSDFTISRSAGYGIGYIRGPRLRLERGEILGSLGTGLAVLGEGRIFRNIPMEFSGPIRITGGASYPASVSAVDAAALLADASAHTALTGNARDTIIVTGTPTQPHQLTIRPELPWRSGSALHFTGTLGRVHMLPGASLTIGVSEVVLTTASTPQQPAVLRSPIGEVGVIVTTEHARHLRLDSLDVTLRGTLEDVIVTGGSLTLETPGSVLRRAEVSGAWPLLMEARTSLEQVTVVAARSDGVRITGAGATITGCAISHARGHGLRVTAPGARIEGCAFEQNHGAGIAAITADTVLAQHNWWGDAAGPTGPHGDSVAGAVIYQPFLSTPPSRRQGIARLELHPASATVAAGDTVRLRALAYRADGGIVTGPDLVWHSEDTLVAVTDRMPARFTGRRPGTTTVVASVRGEPLIRAGADLIVGPGAAYTVWERINVPEDCINTFSDRLAGTTPHAIYLSRGRSFCFFDGNEARPLPALPSTIAVSHLWARSPAELFVASGNGVYVLDPSGWRLLREFPPFPERITALFGTAQELFVGRTNGTDVFDGTGWRSLGGAPASPMWLDGTSSQDLLALSEGILQRYDGTEWRPVGALRGIHATWRATDGEIHAVATDAAGETTLWRGSNGVWIERGPAPQLRVLAGTSGSDLLGITTDRRMVHFDGSMWRPAWPGEQLMQPELLLVDGVAFTISRTGYFLRGRRP